MITDEYIVKNELSTVIELQYISYHMNTRILNANSSSLDCIHKYSHEAFDINQDFACT